MKTAAWVVVVSSLGSLSPVRAADLRIDHVTVAGKDLATLETQLSAAGLRVEKGGPHSNHATAMSIASFPDGSYLELIGLQPNADPAMVAQHPWHTFLEGDAGLVPGRCAPRISPKRPLASAVQKSR